LLVKVVAEGKNYKSELIADFMTKKVKTANLDDDVYDSMRRRAPVEDNGIRLIRKMC